MENKLNIDKKMPSDEEIEKYMDLEGLMQRREAQQKVAFMYLVLLSIKRNARQITIVSVIILFTALSVFAFIKLNKRNNRVKPAAKEKVQNTKSVVSDIRKKFHTQTLLLSTHQDMSVRGGLGSLFLIPTGSFVQEDGQLVRDTVRLSVIEIINKDEIKENNFTIRYNGKNYQPDKVYFLSADKDGLELKVNQDIPFEAVISDSLGGKWEAFYGIEKEGKLAWISYNFNKAGGLEKESHSMLEFQRYEDSKRLLDSLKQYYYLEDNNYKPHARRGMVYTMDFIKEVALFVYKYQDDKNFEAKVKKSIRDWEKYKNARKILINVSGNRKKPETVKIYKSGWFALVRMD